MGRLMKGEGRVVSADALAARDEAGELRAAAAAELARARAEADGLREQARRDGYAEGYAAGREAGAAELVALLSEARVQAQEARARTHDAAVILARKMTEKIVGRAVELDPALMQEIAAQALAACRARSGSVALRVHPDDLAALQRKPPAWAPRAAALDVKLVADANVGRHGCVVETPGGRVDARLDTQLAALERALLGRAHG